MCLNEDLRITNEFDDALQTISGLKVIANAVYVLSQERSIEYFIQYANQIA